LFYYQWQMVGLLNKMPHDTVGRTHGIKSPESTIYRQSPQGECLGTFIKSPPPRFPGTEFKNAFKGYPSWAALRFIFTNNYLIVLAFICYNCFNT
jgi:hypothetical protein